MKDLFVGKSVAEREGEQIKLNVSRLLNQAECAFEDGKRGEAEKIHLEQTDFLDRLHIEGSHNFVVLCLMQRD